MTVLIDVLSGAIGAIIIIVVSLGLPFVRKIIFKLFETKVDERANKAISDHNAKNETKIHTSKALFELEQQAINNNVIILGKLLKIAIETSGMVVNDYNNGIALFHNLEYYTNQNKKIYEYISKYKTENILYSLYIPEEIDLLLNKLFATYKDIHLHIARETMNNSINGLHSFFNNILLQIEEENKLLKNTIREHYNNIKIV